MKRIFCIAAVLALASCNSSQQEQQLKALAAKDSILAAQSQKKDSAISSYITAFNEIQDNLDSIKARERILSGRGTGEPIGSNTVADIKSLDKLIIRNKREINRLESKLKKTGDKNAGLEKMIARLTKEVSEKDAEIAELQSKLANANQALATLTQQFNDSVSIINKQRAEINAMRIEVNTVYYTVGTMKELKAKGLVDKKGGVLGIGRTAELNPELNTSDFTQGDMVVLHAIPLNGKFLKVITSHPDNSYKITGTDKSDSLVITDASSFWSESKYLVVSIK